MSEITSIWTGLIADEYRDGQITTERGLQASLYRFIRQVMPSVSIFVEPGMMYYENGGPRFRPDLVLCEGGHISLIAEIKFVPHWFPEYAGDIEKLKTFAKQGQGCEHNLEINPKDGKWTEKKHCISDDTEYAFFVVGRQDSEAVARRDMEFLIGNGPFNENFWLFYGRVIPGEQTKFGYE